MHVTTSIDDTVVLQAIGGATLPYGGAGTVFKATASERELYLFNNGMSGSAYTPINPVRGRRGAPRGTPHARACAAMQREPPGCVAAPALTDCCLCTARVVARLLHHAPG